MMNRREFTRLLATAAMAAPLATHAAAPFRLRYVLASSMYGSLPLAEILPEVKATGAETIDLWPKPHGTQREEVDSLGLEKFTELVASHGVKVEVITRYDRGPFRMTEEFKLAKQLGTKVIVCGGAGPVGLEGEALKAAVKTFAEKLKPHLAVAEENGVTLAIENHGKNLIDAPDSLRWLREFSTSPALGVAFAPYHFPQDAELQAQLIMDLGQRMTLFYAWQHGQGCSTKLPKEQELEQMPGRGTLDFTPLLRALKKIDFQGITEVFMHPVPRGIPILPTAAETTAEINRARKYLDEIAARA